MGDGGVACVPSQHIMEPFSICGGNKTTSNNNSSNNAPKKPAKTTKTSSKIKKIVKMKPKMKGKGDNAKANKEKGAVESSGKKESLDSRDSINKGSGRDTDNNNRVTGNGNDVNKDEVEEGELGTMDVDNGLLVPEKSFSRKFELKSEIEKGEFVPSGKWRRGEGGEKGDLYSGSWRGAAKDELEKGEFVPDKERWRRSEVVGKDDYGYPRTMRHVSGKEKGWKSDREGWKADREWTPPSSGKYGSDKELNRCLSQHGKRSSRYDSNLPEKSYRISSKIVDEEGSMKSELSNGKNQGRESSSVHRLKRHCGESDGSDRKNRGECDDYSISKSRKLLDDGGRSVYPSEKYSRSSVERSCKNSSSSSRNNVSSDRHSSRHYESSVPSRNFYDKRNSSPHHPEWSPHDRARYNDHRDGSPAHHDRSPYDRGRHHSRSPYNRSRHYDPSRSPYDRSRYHDHRNRSPSYSERSPQDDDRYHARRERTLDLLERSPLDRGKPQEGTRKVGAAEKRKSHHGNKGQEEKPNQKDLNGKDSHSVMKESKGRSTLDSGDGPIDRIQSDQLEKDVLSDVPDVNDKELPPGSGVTEEMPSMEEDMDICNTPPHVSAVADATTGKWLYIDHSGVERGPSTLFDLKRLVEEGFLVSDHFIKHIDCERWITVENAVSPLVTANFPSIVSDTITKLVSPPEASGNLLADNGDASNSSSDSTFSSIGSCNLSVTAEDLRIDERVGALLEGVTLTPGRELKTIGEVLQMTFEYGEWGRWEIGEGEHYDQVTCESISSDPQSAETANSGPNLLAPSEKDTSLVWSDSSAWISGLWSCKGGDWRRSDDAVLDRLLKKKLVLNDGYPLCQMPKSGNEDPRWQRKDELYYPSPSRRLELPPWAFTSPDEWNDRSNQSKSALLRGVKGSMLPVIRINACVVKDHGSFVSESRTKVRAKERYSTKASRQYPSSDTKRLSEDGVSRSKDMHEEDSQAVLKNGLSIGTPKDHVCTANELQLHLGDWFYLDGSGHEHGPSSFLELQRRADQGIILKNSSVFRKVDRVWVPISFSAEASQPAVNAMLSNKFGSSYAAQSNTGSVSRGFHDLHPQFIGYTRGKLHELVMKSYKSREFAAAVNEFLDPWINARQPKKEMEKNMHNPSIFQKSDLSRATKRARFDESEEDFDMENVLYGSMECSFDELCGDEIFYEERAAQFETPGESWGLLDGHVLARIFHFLRADIRSLVKVSLTCKSWRSAFRFYKNICTQVDVCSVANICSDSLIHRVMNDYNKEKIRSLIVRGCAEITSGALEDILRSFPHLTLIDIRGCSQFEELASKYPHVNWVKSCGSHLKIRSLKQINDSTSIALKTYNGLDSRMDDSSGLRNYLESSERRKSANQLFHQSLYKRSKLFDARKTPSILSRDAHLRRLAMRKYEYGYKRMAEFLVSSLKDIMKQNTFGYFVPKVTQIEGRIKNGYYAGRGLSSIKEDIRRMCRDAIKLKNRGNAADMNRIIALFIRLATCLDGGSTSSYGRDETMKSWKDDSPPGFSSASSKYKKVLSKGTEKKLTNRSNGTFANGMSDYGDYASDREIRRRLSKLNRKTMDSGSETSEDSDKTSDESTSVESTASDTESDLEEQAESGSGESRGEVYFTPDDGLDSLADDREWGARMTKASLVPPVTRKYEVIDHYVIVAEEEEVKRKMQVSLPDDYTEKLMAQKNGTEESDMEIPEVKDYKPRKQLGDEVIEQEVYGIDPYTHNLLLDSMPEDSDWSLLDKYTFIEDVLLRTLNEQVRHFTGSGNVPMTYPLKPVFEEIIETAEDDNDKRTMRLCQHILKAIDSRPEDKYVAYRKGLGVVCNKEGGFGEDDFVVEFLGEVYPAWKWFEKQDGIRSLQKNSNDPAPEFYNIYLERPKGDADGYDLVVVDAMHKANYASRICHSCRPNCEAKVTAVDGQYQIGIYTVRPIRNGEEVTFDYNSVTESKEECEASVCLCGSHVCRGSYLNLTGEGAFQKVLKEYHGILDRLHLMLEACELNSVSEEDLIELGKAGLGSCLLGGLPDWLIAYSARLVRFINFERTKLPDEILRHNLEEKKKYFSDVCYEGEKCDAEVQAEGVYNQRLQNLALTLDKVRYVMKCVFGDPKKAPPPLERLSPEAVISFLWKGEGSLVEELLQCITPHIVDDTMLRDLKTSIRAHDPSGFDDIQSAIRKSLIWLRDEVRNLPCTYKCRHDAAADLIHIYAHTKCFFRIREYKTVTSPPVYISPLDLCPKYAEKVGSSGHEYCKTYGVNYCLGQLIYWHIQTNSDPDSCLARAGRGCLSLPDIDSFYAKVQKPSRQRIYGPRTVKFMLARMEKQPQRPWPKDRIWSFTSNPKIIGSPMLDAALYKTPLDKEMVQWLKQRPPIFQAMWDR